MANQNDSAQRSGKTETLDEVLIRLGYLKPEQTASQDERLAAILTRIQRMNTEWYTLMSEHSDWLVVLQCLQDHHLFKSNPKRPPLTEFIAWLNTNHVPQLLAQASVRSMSHANNRINGARYPWTDVTWNRHVIRRWRILYETLQSFLQDITRVIE